MTSPIPTDPISPEERQRLEDVGFMTCMTLVLLGNYNQTGHFGGPLAYTPFNVAAHFLGPERGGLRYDYRRPKHPYGDKFMLAAGHCAPTCYALWMILGEALYRKHRSTGDQRYYVAPDVAMLPVDALGFRRGAGALKTLLSDQGLADDPLFAQAKGRGIRALSGHIESIDVTNDVNGGPSGVGIATAAGKAAIWDIIGAPMGTPKIIALEGEFAMTEGHAQEIKTQAMALQVGKRLRIFVSLAQTFEKKYGVEFAGIRKGPVTDAAERLVLFKTNMDVVMSVLDKNGLGDWLAERLLQIADSVKDELPTRVDVKHDPFLDE